MRIGFDIDDTLNDLRYSSLEIFNRYFGLTATKEEIDADGIYNVADVFLIKREESDYFWETNSKSLFFNSLPLPHSVLLLCELSEQGHEIFYVTSRNIKYEDVTRDWLKKHHFPFIGNLHIGMKNDEKVNILLENGIVLYFDDKDRIIDSVKAAGIEGIVKDQCYNQNWQGKRIQCWSQFHEIISL